jgi:MoaA/NifB/PqqE/SkfB family radical SAM enzyme
MGSRLINSYLADATLKAKWDKIKSLGMSIRISGYDITNQCNLRCEGCFFFEGELSSNYASENTLDEYNTFFASEKARGITYPHFAGAEPALVQDRLRVAAQHWDRGLIYTNGTIKLDSSLPFMIHISVWGGDKTDKLLRGGKVLERAINNYRGDKRAIFLYTINPQNIADIPDVVKRMSDNNLRISFNHFSASRQYKAKIVSNAGHDAKSTYRLSDKDSNLIFTKNDLLKSRDVIAKMLADFPETVVFSSKYNELVHQGDPIFNIDPASGVATNCAILTMPYHRQHHTDFSFSDTECCIANVDCSECRHYVSVYTHIMSQMKQYVKNPTQFEAWLDVYYTWCRLHFVDWN